MRLRNKDLVLIALGAALFFFTASPVAAEEIDTTVEVNAKPNVSAIQMQDADGGTIQLNANDTRTVTCNGTISDLDGGSDVTNVSGIMYGPSSSAAGTPSAGLYYEPTCTLGSPSGTDVPFTCTQDYDHNSEPGSWTCEVTAEDTFNATGSGTATESVDTFRSIAVTESSIDFGKLGLGETTGTTDFTVPFNNTGNVGLDTAIDAYSTAGSPSDTSAFSCTSGSIPVNATRFATQTGQFAESQKTPLSDSPTAANVSLSPTSFGSTAFTQDEIHYGLVIPDSGVAGTCNGIIDMSAVAP